MTARPRRQPATDTAPAPVTKQPLDHPASAARTAPALPSAETENGRPPLRETRVKQISGGDSRRPLREAPVKQAPVKQMSGRGTPEPDSSSEDPLEPFSTRIRRTQRREIDKVRYLTGKSAQTIISEALTLYLREHAAGHLD